MMIAATAGTVEIYADGTIATTGAYAHGIFAASTAGSTILSQTSDGLAIYGNHGLAISGAVSIEQSGSIVVSGEGSVGLYALANNWNTDDSIKVTQQWGYIGQWRRGCSYPLAQRSKGRHLRERR